MLQIYFWYGDLSNSEPKMITKIRHGTNYNAHVELASFC